MNNNQDENRSELKAEAVSFKVGEPLNLEQRATMYKELVHSMESFRKMDELFDERFPKDTPDRNVKRAFAMASTMAEFLVEHLEKHGCTVNMDADAMQGVLTPLLLPGPAIACEAIQEVDAYIRNK